MAGDFSELGKTIENNQYDFDTFIAESTGIPVRREDGVTWINAGFGRV